MLVATYSIRNKRNISHELYLPVTVGGNSGSAWRRVTAYVKLQFSMVVPAVRDTVTCAAFVTRVFESVAFTTPSRTTATCASPRSVLVIAEQSIHRLESDFHRPSELAFCPAFAGTLSSSLGPADVARLAHTSHAFAVATTVLLRGTLDPLATSVHLIVFIFAGGTFCALTFRHRIHLFERIVFCHCFWRWDVLGHAWRKY